MNEKTINIAGQEVKMIYCAATENVYEDTSKKSIAVFIPHENEKKELVIDATIGDFLTLGYAGIVAAYVRDKKEVPIEFSYILYNSTPNERNEIISSIIELRTKWYAEPSVVAEKRKTEPKAEKKVKTKN